MFGDLDGLKKWPTKVQKWERHFNGKPAQGESHNQRRRRKTELIQSPTSRESVGSEGEGVGSPACRQHGTGEGAAAFLLAVQEPERPREILWERQGSRAPLHRLLSWPRGGSLPRTYSKILQFQWNTAGLWPWPVTDAVWRQSQRDGPQGKCWVQQARWAQTNIFSWASVPLFKNCSCIFLAWALYCNNWSFQGQYKYVMFLGRSSYFKVSTNFSFSCLFWMWLHFIK